MAEKKEAESHNPVFTFCKSMAQTVTQFPPSITAETRVQICQLVAQMEAKALHEQNQARASGFPFHNFSPSFDYQVPCYSCHGNVPPAPCQSSAQMLSSPSLTIDSCSHVSLSDPKPKPTPPQNGKGEAVQMKNLTPTLPDLLMSSSDWYIYILAYSYY